MKALHGAVDYAYWHGVFKLMQDIYEPKNIHSWRMESGEID
jgi:hypothetical protein